MLLSLYRYVSVLAAKAEDTTVISGRTSYTLASVAKDIENPTNPGFWGLGGPAPYISPYFPGKLPIYGHTAAATGLHVLICLALDACGRAEVDMLGVIAWKFF